jgi:hypothetical protein
MPQIMTHSCAVQPIARLEIECRIVNEGEIIGEVDCPTLQVELIQEEIETTLEDDCVIEGELDQDELVVEVEEDEV